MNWESMTVPAVLIAKSPLTVASCVPAGTPVLVASGQAATARAAGAAWSSALRLCSSARPAGPRASAARTTARRVRADTHASLLCIASSHGFALLRRLHPVLLLGIPQLGQPRHLPSLHHVLENLPVLQRVHGAEETRVPVGDELAVLDQPVEGLIHQLFAFLDVVEDAVAEDEEAGVYPD